MKGVKHNTQSNKSSEIIGKPPSETLEGNAQIIGKPPSETLEGNAYLTCRCGIRTCINNKYLEANTMSTNDLLPAAQVEVSAQRLCEPRGPSACGVSGPTHACSKVPQNLRATDLKIRPCGQPKRAADCGWPKELLSATLGGLPAFARCDLRERDPRSFQDDPLLLRHEGQTTRHDDVF